MAELENIYRALEKSYGKQGWWPIINNKTLLCEYHTGAPKNEQERFEIIIGAVLTQNTSWTNVEKAIFNLNKAKLLSPEKLAKAKESKIAELIKPAGYFNQKAKRIKFLANYFINNPKLLNKEIKELRMELLSLNGIGPETADSIILYAAEKPSFVIDAYTKRIFSRLLAKDLGDYNNWKEFFESNLNHDVKLFNEYHALIVEHAKQSCNKTPKCNDCILKSGCLYSKKSFLVKKNP